MRRRFLVGVAIAAASAAGVALAASLAGASSPTPAASALPPNPAPDFPGTVTFQPVADGFVPAISASGAAAVALQQLPDGQVIRSDLALFTGALCLWMRTKIRRNPPCIPLPLLGSLV